MNQTEKNAGWIAGISLIIMSLAAGFSYGYVHNELFSISAVITKPDMEENKLLFLAGLAGWVVIFISDLIVAGALYVFFKSTMRRLSLFTAFVRISYTLVLGVAVYQLISILPLLQGSHSSFEINSHVEAFQKIWSAGLIIFGFHLLGLGYLSVKSQIVSSVLGYLLYVAGLSYVLVHSAKQFTLFAPAVIASIEHILALPMALSEILLAVWFIYKGMKKEGTIIKTVNYDTPHL